VKSSACIPHLKGTHGTGAGRGAFNSSGWAWRHAGRGDAYTRVVRERALARRANEMSVSFTIVSLECGISSYATRAFSLDP
jgi:hypothetical protein